MQPSGEMDHDAAWSELQRIRASLLATVEAADGLALSTVTHNHPVFGTLNVYQLMDFIAGHEMRHARADQRDFRGAHTAEFLIGDCQLN